MIMFLKLNPLNSWSALNLMKDRLQGPTNFLWMPVSLDFERVICSAFDEPVRTPEVSALKVLLLIWKYKDWQHSKGCKRMVKQQHSYWWPRLLCTSFSCGIILAFHVCQNVVNEAIIVCTYYSFKGHQNLTLIIVLVWV